MRRKYIVSLVVAALSFQFAIFQVFAAEGVLADTLSDDAEIQQVLSDIDERARNETVEFAKKLSRKYNIPEDTVDWLLKEVGMSPGEATMAARVSKAADRPVEDVANAYRKNRGKGWGAIAKEMGIKPGSEEFHALKSGDTAIPDALGSEKKGKDKDKGKGKGKGKGKSKGKKGKE